MSTRRLSPAGAVTGLALLASLAMKLHRLGHLALRGLDESFHAVVAQSLIHHPLTPTLYDHAWLPLSSGDWQNSHVWLHKGIVPLWQMAASMGLLGQTTFAMRLPSAVLGTLAAGLTYAIGRKLAGPWAAAIAATLQAFNPPMWMLTHGLAFSDHIDICLLFWTELSIFLVLCVCNRNRRNSSVLALAAGVAQGLAFCTKSYPALIATGITLVAWLTPKFWPEESPADDSRPPWPGLRGRDVLWMFVGTVLSAGPWLVYCWVRFPAEFSVEQLQVLRHLTQNVEGWAGPWDRVAFDYLLWAFHVFYPTLLAALPLLAWRAVRQRDRRLLILLAWLVGAVAPHLLATAKTPSATLVGWPAGLLLLGVLTERAIRGDAPAAAIWLTTAVLGCVMPGTIPASGWGFVPGGAWAAIMRQNIWVIWHAIAGVAAGVLVGLVGAAASRRRVVQAASVAAGIASVWLLGQLVTICWNVTNFGADQPAFVETGQFVRAHLPWNAVLLVDEGEKCEHMTAMFYCQRSAYALDHDAERYLFVVNEIAERGGLPVVLSQRPLPLRVLNVSLADGWTLYACDVAEFRARPPLPAGGNGGGGGSTRPPQ